MKIMDEIRVAEIRRDREDDDIEFLLKLIERESELHYPDYYESEDRVDELENQTINLTLELEELKIKLNELRNTTVKINLGDYI